MTNNNNNTMVLEYLYGKEFQRFLNNLQMGFKYKLEIIDRKFSNRVERVHLIDHHNPSNVVVISKTTNSTERQFLKKIKEEMKLMELNKLGQDMINQEVQDIDRVISQLEDLKNIVKNEVIGHFDLYNSLEFISHVLANLKDLPSDLSAQFAQFVLNNH